ncbi:hypothetical protein F7725_015362 [Dissostichus mawsoni]|uniref:Uncharacterized protein n=1 Tax=Dissostichus mawsoni TaxID=36200 RepID=A0A7J5YHD8_DISMA|nr:hypothetical protein F7725_015362 [Dissostichus mawsoni]
MNCKALSAGGGTLSNNIWQKAGITTIGQIYRDQTLPFQQLKNQYGLSDSSFLSYAQIASIIGTKCKREPCLLHVWKRTSASRKQSYHQPAGNVARSADRLWTLGCLATKRLVLLNWKERKPACFTRDSWLREYLDLLNMSAALLSDPVNMASPV